MNIKQLHKNRSRGFTLIELLVVIAIIGILAGIVIVSFTGIQAKARDSKRVSELKQMQTIIAGEIASNPTSQALTGCTTAYADVTTCAGPTGSGTTDDITTQFPNMSDPSGSATTCQGTASGTPSTSTCQYSIASKAGGANPATGDYEICGYLESGAAGIPSGLFHVDSDGNLATGCN